MKGLFVLLFLSAEILANSQSTNKSLFDTEISFMFDNDNLLFNLHDGYYTNGLFFKLNKASQTKSQKKKIISYELGQLIFTSGTRRIELKSQIDRPYTGYLYLRYGQTCFSSRQIIKWSGEIGTIGAASQGQQVQELFHKLIDVWEYPGWETQLEAEPSINLKFNYLLPGRSSAKRFKIIPSIEANLGNAFTNAKAGAYFCVGAFEDNENSALWDAAVAVNKSETRKRHYEFFGFFYPHVLMQGYNSTVQGGMFRKYKGGYVSGINHILYQHLAGLVYSKKRFKFQVNIAFQTREAKSQKRNHNWAALGAAYRFN